MLLKIVVLVVLTACNPAAVVTEEDAQVQDLKDLLLASVQNVVALNTLATSQTQRISELMLTMSSNRMQIDDMGLKYNLALRKIEGLEETIGALKTENHEQDEKLQELEVKDQEFEAKDQAFEEKNLEFKEKLQELEEKDQTFEQKLQELEVKDQEFEAMDQELKSEIDHYGNPVTVLNGEEGTGNSQCAKVCSGTTGRTSSNWSQHGSKAIKMTVDISGCGFTKIPTITTSLEKTVTFAPPIIGGASVVAATSTQFLVYLRREGSSISPGTATSSSYKFNMEWIAVGFTC